MRPISPGLTDRRRKSGGWRIEKPMHQPPCLLGQAASNARLTSGPAFSRSAADETRTSRSPVPR